MRIGLVSPPWLSVPPHGYGGTESMIDVLARGLALAGHEVVLVGHPASTCPVERRSVIPADADLPIGDAMHEVRHAIGAYDVLRDVDVIHDHTVVGPLLAPNGSRVPAVTTMHGAFDELSIPIYRRIGEEVPIVAISHAHARSAGGVPIARVVHHGLDLSQFPVGRGGDHLLFLGRMCPEKGAHRAIRIARAAGVPLVIAAKMREPLERAYFDAEVRPLLGRGVEYIGEPSFPEKIELLRSALALVNPIRWPEPFGLVMIEALACGTPVVAYDAGAAPEIVVHGRTGLLCRTQDEMVAAVALVAGIERPVCRDDCEERFSMRRMVGAYVSVYEGLLAAGASRGASAVGGA
jgi:glycosyltransferase involved in cell wall biosynthesis